MKIWRRIGKLSIRQLFVLSTFVFRRPRTFIPLVSATGRTMEICNTLYGKEHFGNNFTNAFRHALWNILIAQKVNKIYKNDSKSTDFTKKITDLYEKITKNAILDEVMDLHNNRIGREIFLAKKGKNEVEIIHFLKKMSENAVKIQKIDDIVNSKDKLVFISE